MKKKLKVKKAFRGKLMGRPRGAGVIINPSRPGQPQANTFNSTPFPRGEINPAQVLPPTQQPVIGGMGPRPNNFGPMQGVGDPRLGAAIIPGNKLQMQMRGPTQAMKKGGMVRGSGAAIKGVRKAKLL